MPRVKKTIVAQPEAPISTTQNVSVPPDTSAATKPENFVAPKDDYSAVESDGVRVRHFNKGGDAERMYQHLSSQPKVPFFIPLGWGEKEGAEQWCQINDLAIMVRKNQMVELPQQVANHLMESLRLTDAALKPFVITKEGKVVRSTEAKQPFAAHGE